jgi:hypothetical protein
MFYNARHKLGMSKPEALDWMDHRFNVEYPRKGMAFAVGNMAAYPKVWQLLRVLRLDESKQASLL